MDRTTNEVVFQRVEEERCFLKTLKEWRPKLISITLQRKVDEFIQEENSKGRLPNQTIRLHA